MQFIEVGWAGHRKIAMLDFESPDQWTASSPYVAERRCLQLYI